MDSLACPVLRDDADQWLAQPYVVDCIAPNAGAIRHNEPAQRQHIVPTLTERASKILAASCSSPVRCSGPRCFLVWSLPERSCHLRCYLPRVSLPTRSLQPLLPPGTLFIHPTPSQLLPGNLPIWSEEEPRWPA